MRRFIYILITICMFMFFKGAHQKIEFDPADQIRMAVDGQFATIVYITIIVIRLLSDLGLAAAIYFLVNRW